MKFTEKFNIKSKVKLKVLVAPLDWGLGHATRCIPLIKYLISMNCEVIIAGEGIQQLLLREEFPDLEFVNLAGYRITFSKNRGKTLIKFFRQIPKILISIKRERTWLQLFLQKNSVDIIMSDNRYGLFNKKIVSVFITHQLTIKAPFGKFVEKTLRAINYQHIEKFHECWVPDFEGTENMGGELSHPLKMPSIPVKFLGKLSRIEEGEVAVKKTELLIILSGPEPQRSFFEKILLTQLETFGGATILVRGLPGETTALANYNKNLCIYNHLATVALNEIINEATYIVSRSGYSTIMDLIGSHKKCIFVPTPGQSEQEYLAEYLSSRKLCLSYRQSKFQLENALRDAGSFSFHSFKLVGYGQYKNVIDDLVNGLVLNN